METKAELGARLGDPRISKLPHVANCWRGGPDIYTVLSDAMVEAGFSKTEFTIGRIATEGEIEVLSGSVRANDAPYRVFLRGIRE